MRLKPIILPFPEGQGNIRGHIFITQSFLNSPGLQPGDKEEGLNGFSHINLLNALETLPVCIKSMWREIQCSRAATQLFFE
jgi:hypothetical protein